MYIILGLTFLCFLIRCGGAERGASQLFGGLMPVSRGGRCFISRSALDIRFSTRIEA